eukprot:TRINITY_DN123623_c0_g1_i1.p1 TRINITY_DN123623_c0_g1~~TRINITY_DN123623_c0_g1_i1.p1  ORF type:complete len:186 (+),score=1.91 TRINITY_DN123623_c0_g1_i1:705-1262(+)
MLADMCIRKISFAENSCEIYGCTIIGFDVLMNQWRIGPLDSHRNTIEVAKCILVLLHELGHCIRIKRCSNGCFLKRTPKRYLSSVPEAGCYCIYHALELTNVQYISLIKNMNQDLASVVINPDEWINLWAFKEKLLKHANEYPMVGGKYKKTAIPVREVEQLKVKLSVVQCMKLSRGKVGWVTVL